MADKTWTQTDGNLASTAANWDGGVAPVAGDNIIFDATSTANCTWDLATNSFGKFTIAAGYSGTITQSSDIHISGYEQVAGDFTPLITKFVYCNGPFIPRTGHVTTGVLNLVLNGSALRLYSTGNNYQSITITENSTVYIQTNDVLSYKIYNYGTIDVKQEHLICRGKVFENTGLIYGAGGLRIEVDENRGFVYGNINCTIEFKSVSWVAGDFKVTLQSNEELGNVTILSGHATNTLTLDTAGYNLNTSSITVGTRGILANSAATDSVVT